jgi:DNA-binding transcriptional regulator YiaG
LTPADIAALQKRLRLNRAQFARVLDVSVSRLNDYMGKRSLLEVQRAIPTDIKIALETLARYAEVGVI